MSQLIITFETGSDEVLRPQDVEPLAQILGPLGGAGARVSIELRPQPDRAVGSFLPDVQAVTAAVPWAASGAVGIALIKSLTTIATEWIRAGTQRSFRVTTPDGRTVEVKGREVDPDELRELLGSPTDDTKT